MVMRRVCRATLLLMVGWGSSFLPAQQQVTVSTPMIGVRDQFYEHFGLGWGLYGNRPGQPWFLNFGGPMSAPPPFGGYSPGSGLQFGMGRTWSGGGGYFNFVAEAGSQRSLTMSAPSVTMMNGSTGYIFDGTLRPFVTGLIPVVGGYPGVPYGPAPYYGPYYGPPGMPAAPAPTMTSPLAEKLDRLKHAAEVATPGVPAGVPDPATDSLSLTDSASTTPAATGSPSRSSAERGDVSVAEIRRQQAEEEARAAAELAQLIREARTAEAERKWALARVRYQQAAAKASGQQRTELLAALKRLQ